jgi:hypothetical protein
MSCRCSSSICDGCLDSLAPNTQAAFFLSVAAEYADADFNYVDSVQALKQISASNGNIVPLDGRQIAGLKLHREEDDDEEIDGNPAAITTATRDILLKALLHTHNTEEANAELQLKADTLAASMAEADAAITVLRTKLQRMEDEAAALKRIHSTAAHMLACNKLRGFGKLQQSPVAAAKEKALFRKRCSFEPAVADVAAVAAVADVAGAAAEDEEMTEAAALPSESEDESSDEDSDDKPPTYVFPPSPADSEPADSDDDASPADSDA